MVSLVAQPTGTSSIATLWAAIQRLSYEEVEEYTKDIELLSRNPSIRNPLPHNAKAVGALLHLHRYSKLRSPSDVIQASSQLLEAVALDQEPEYACFFHLAASHSLEIFERTSVDTRLDQAIELLQHFSGAPGWNTNAYMMAVIEVACDCIRYYLAFNEPQALQTATDMLEEGRGNSPEIQWAASSSTDLRISVLVAHVLSIRYDLSFAEEDLTKSIRAILSVLQEVCPPLKHRYTALDILVLAIVFILAQNTGFAGWVASLDELHAILNADLNTTTNEAALKALVQALEQSTVTTSQRPICLLHLADTLRSQLNNNSSDISGTLYNDEGQLQWAEEWEAARLYLHRRLEFAETLQSSNEQLFTAFKFTMELVHRDQSGFAQVRFRSKVSIGVHECMFKAFAIPDVIASDETTADPEDAPHRRFYKLLQAAVKKLSSNDIRFLIDHPVEVDRLFKESDYLFESTVAYDSWKESPAVIAYLILEMARRDAKSGMRELTKAALLLLKIHLEPESPFDHLIYQLAAQLREYETESAAIGTSSELIKQFLQVQERGTAKHLLAVIELGSTFFIDYFNHPTQPPAFALALELFREAMSLVHVDSWLTEGRKVVVLGRILHYRYKHYSESNISLNATMQLFARIWDLIPTARPFRTSVMEMTVTSTLLCLSKELPTGRWHDSLKLFALVMELRTCGTIEEGNGDVKIRNQSMTSQDLLEGGLHPSSTSFASEPICLAHISDIMRSIAFDCSKHPGFLPLALDMYLRSLQYRPSDSNDRFRNAKESNLLAACAEEYDLLGQLILLCTENMTSLSTLSFEQTPLTIFQYRATQVRRAYEPNLSHDCVLSYYPTLVSLLQATSDSTSIGSTETADEAAEERNEPLLWPEHLIGLPDEPDDSVARYSRPSTIIHGIETFLQDENHELFKMPLEQRTIRAFIRNLDSEVRETEAQVSMTSQGLIHQTRDAVYFDAREVQLETRMAHLKTRTPYLARLGPLQALLTRGPERCLELVEAARSHFWTRLLRLRTSFDGLPEELANELQDVAQELEKCKSQTNVSVSKEEMVRQFELEGIFASLVHRARKVPGFENLLMPMTHDILMKASSEGPIVVLLGNDSTYAALTIRPHGIDSVFLPGLTDTILDKLIVGLNRATNAARGAMGLDSDANDTADDSEFEPHHAEEETGRGRVRIGASVQSYETLLEQLWTIIVKPIFDALGFPSNFDSSRPRPRLWWCPTGKLAFLPVHAAGRNFGKGIMTSTSKYVVSSYTPTISALLSARASGGPSPAAVEELKTLVLAQPTTANQSSLPMTLKEVELLEKTVPTDLLIRVGDGDRLSKSNTNRKVDEALEHIPEAAILHLACHGHQDRVDPLNSGFQLDDGRLTVSRLMSCHTPNAVLAFLSACESASNDLNVPDESLNLAAAMLYAGFRSVIGTMWSMNDSDGPQVAATVYEELFRQVGEGRGLKPDTIPRALDSAIQKLQVTLVQPNSSSRWATYIHVGI